MHRDVWRVARIGRPRLVGRRKELEIMKMVKDLISAGYHNLDQPREGAHHGFLVLRTDTGKAKYIPLWKE